MGIFDKLAGDFGGNLVVGLAAILALTVTTIQVISIILTQLFGFQQLSLGGALGIIAVSAGVVFAFVTGMTGGLTNRANLYAILLIGAVVAFIYFGLPKLAPDIMKPAMSILKVGTMSLFGL